MSTYHETTISGIPCVVEVTGYQPGHAAKVNADPDSCYEGEAPEISFEVLDRRCRPAPWLARKLTQDESDRIECELLEADRSYNAGKKMFHKRNDARALKSQIKTQDKVGAV